VWEQKLGPDYADNGIFHNNIGDVLRDRGECRTALPQYERAIALFEPTYGEDYPELLYPLTGLGACQASLGDDDAARSSLERALAVSPAGDYPAGYLAHTRFALAQLLGEDARALELAELALADANGEPGQPQVAAIEAWIAARR